jgi:MSHA biogenesis protein MshP
MKKIGLNMGGRAKGFALLSAIAILVLLSALAAYLARIAALSQIGAAQDILGSRAYHAARSGVEWGIYKVLIGGTCNASSTSLPAIASDAAVGFHVFVTCESGVPYQEGASSFYVYKITAIACNASTCPPSSLPAGYVERELSATVSK